LQLAGHGRGAADAPDHPVVSRKPSPGLLHEIAKMGTLGVFGTVRYLVFFVIALKTRAVEIAGIAVDPDGEWMKQMARNLTDRVDGFLREAKYLIPSDSIRASVGG
jgi:hypothetical protein